MTAWWILFALALAAGAAGTITNWRRGNERATFIRRPDTTDLTAAADQLTHAAHQLTTTISNYRRP